MQSENTSSVQNTLFLHLATSQANISDTLSDLFHNTAFWTHTHTQQLPLMHAVCYTPPCEVYLADLHASSLGATSGKIHIAGQPAGVEAKLKVRVGSASARLAVACHILDCVRPPLSLHLLVVPVAALNTNHQTV